MSECISHHEAVGGATGRYGSRGMYVCGMSVYICCTFVRGRFIPMVDQTTSRHVAGSRSTNTKTNYSQEQHLQVDSSGEQRTTHSTAHPIPQPNSLIFGVNVGIARADNAPVAFEEQWHYLATKPHRSMSEMCCRETVKSTLTVNDTNSHQ